MLQVYKLNDDVERDNLYFSDIVSIVKSDEELNSLRYATLEEFCRLKIELAFVKFILSRSPVLQRIKIYCINSFKVNYKWEYLLTSRKTMRFRRASAELEIIYAKYMPDIHMG